MRIRSRNYRLATASQRSARRMSEARYRTLRGTLHRKGWSQLPVDASHQRQLKSSAWHAENGKGNLVISSVPRMLDTDDVFSPSCFSKLLCFALMSYQPLRTLTGYIALSSSIVVTMRLLIGHLFTCPHCTNYQALVLECTSHGLNY